MQENNDRYIYKDVDGKIVSVEEATEIQKNQKKAFRLKIAALCLAVAVGGLIASEINDKDTDKDNTVQESDNSQFSDEKNIVYNQESKEYIDEMIDEYLKPSFDNMESKLITSVSEESYEVEEIEEENDKLENEKKTAELSRTDMLKVFVEKGFSIDDAENEVLALEEKEANENDSLTILESFFIEKEAKNIKNSEEAEQLFNNFKSNHNDYQKYKRLVFLDKNAGYIVITTPYNLSDYWNENDYEFIGSSDKINVFVYEKEARNVQMEDTDNYRVISDWYKTGEYVIADERKSHVDDISTRYSLRAFSVRGGGIERKDWHPYANCKSFDPILNRKVKDNIVDTSKVADNVYDAARGNFISQDKIYEEAFSDENIRELNDYGIVEGMNIQSIESNDGTIIGYTVEENTTSGKVR